MKLIDRVVLVLLLTLCSNLLCLGQTRDHPIIPFTTNFWNYWDHYWTTWLNDHPKYEAIELTTFDNPKSDYKLIRVFLSEKAGRKQQYYYLNDHAAVARSRANTYYRDIIHRRTGKPGGPQNLYIKFKDRDDQLIEWSIDFDANQKMVRHEGGLTPSIHSVGLVLLYHLRTKKADSKTDRVLFDGKDYSYANTKGVERRSSWYNSDTYSSVIVFGKNTFQVSPDSITDTWGRTLQRSPNNKLQYVSNDLGKENFIKFDVDKRNQITEYQHTSFGHSFTFSFNPALPCAATAKDGQVIDYFVSFDRYSKLMTGKIYVLRNDDEIVLTWTHFSPDWAKTRSFKSSIKLDKNGYVLTTTERQEPAN